MRCKTCDYSLWNLKGRQCPECGNGFVPSEFDFVINSVRFCCPHCDQSYYGTGPQGHLVPSDFNCVTCGNRIEMDGMVLRPAEGVREEQTQIDRMPWLERQQRGWIKGWIHTVGRSMGNPMSLMRGTTPESGVMQAWWYATVSLVIILGMGGGLPLMVISAILLLNGSNDAIQTFLGGLGIVVVGTIGSRGFMAVWGATAHGILRITGKTEYTIGRTYQALLYSVGVTAPMGVPLVGPYCASWFMWIWQSISAIIMLTHAQRVHGGRATVAILALPLLSWLAIVVGYSVLIMSIFSGRGGMGGARMITISGLEARNFNDSIHFYAAANNGQVPAHAAQLMLTGMGSNSFVASGTVTDVTTIPFGDTTLDKIDYMPPNRKANAIDAVAKAMPANTIAHRCGDFVFTYHGIDLNNCDPGLWVVILSPDPTTGGAAGGTGTTTIPAAQCTAVSAGGKITALGTNVAAYLAVQNQLRAASNLPPLPDPATVLNGSPAVGPTAVEPVTTP